MKVMYVMNEKSGGEYYIIFFHFLLILISIVVCYSSTLEHEWHFDDHQNILWNENIRIENLTLRELKETFNGLVSRSGPSRPIAYLSFGINYYFNGFDPKGFHIFNIAVHIISAFFVYLIFLKTLRIIQEKEKSSGTFLFFRPHEVALLGAFIWALHPIHTQAVTFIVQRMASMAGMFYLIAMYSYLIFREVHRGTKKYILLFLSVFFWIAGVFTKENVILFPLAVLGYEFAFFNSSKLSDKKMLFVGGIFFPVAILLAYLLVRGNILDVILYPYEFRPFSLWQRIITEPIILLRYIFLLLLPVQDFLTRETPIWASRSFFDPPITLFANIFTFALSLFSVVFLRKYPVLCFAIFFYFVNHLVESTILGLELYHEHRNYLPSVFIYLAIAFYLLEVFSLFRRKGFELLSYLMVMLILLFLVGEGNATYLRNDVWKNELVCMEDAVKKSPLNLRPYVTLAGIYINRQEYGKALEYLKIAEGLIEKYPDRYQKSWQGDLYANAANIYLYSAQHRNERKALQLYIKSQEFKGSYHLWRSYAGAGIIYMQNGDLKNAETAFLNAIALHPNGQDASLYNMYGHLLYKIGRYDDAIYYFKKSLNISNITIEYYLNIIGTYLKRGDIDIAKEKLRGMPSLDNNMLYLLYKIRLFDGETRSFAKHKVFLYLENYNIDFCQWIGQIKGDNVVGIVFPDFESLEEEFIKAYSDYLNEKILKETARAELYIEKKF